MTPIGRIPSTTISYWIPDQWATNKRQKSSSPLSVTGRLKHRTVKAWRHGKKQVQAHFPLLSPTRLRAYSATIPDIGANGATWWIWKGKEKPSFLPTRRHPRPDKSGSRKSGRAGLQNSVSFFCPRLLLPNFLTWAKIRYGKQVNWLWL